MWKTMPLHDAAKLICVRSHFLPHMYYSPLSHKQMLTLCGSFLRNLFELQVAQNLNWIFSYKTNIDINVEA